WIIKYEVNMDQTDRIPYEEALALKEIGYSWPCSALFEISLTEQIDEQDGKSGPFGWEKGEVNYRVDYFVNNLESVDWSNKDWLIVGAPIWQRAFKWFRDKHNLLVKPDKYPRKGYYFVIMNTKRVYDFRGFGNYKDI